MPTGVSPVVHTGMAVPVPEPAPQRNLYPPGFSASSSRRVG
jgi:hypothetical protein